ncbi:hypothetical protein HD806DRAFT_513075 [Xylariaceae sp. AK1471]|nr:hypothetical protein HD806DRAFT_513075 [Xylariaceae sp. AK1471]
MLDCLRNLVSPPIPGSQMSAAGRSLGTCRRISNTREFCDWYRRHGGSNERVLWLTGTAGSGKSTQLRHLRCRMEKQWMSATTSIIYCSAEGQSLDRIFVSGSKLGNKRSVMTIRSLLSQLFAEDLDLRQRLSDLFDGRASDADLTRFFLDSYITSKLRTLARRTFILVDAEDSCDSVYILELLNCLCQMAQNSSFSVCLASQPTSGDIPANVTQLELKNNNFEEIEHSVKSRLRATWEERSVLVKKITEKAQGSLLWARLATNLLNETIDGGGAQDLVDQILGEFPADLYGLYEWILGTLSSKEKVDATTIMRWAMLSPEPMVLNDLRMAVCLARTSFLDCCDPYTALDVGLPWSMQELQKTGKHFDTPSQFYHWLRTRTCGLLETRPAAKEGKGQQSLGLQHVYPIHESVRSFFLSGRGFAALSSGRTTTVSSNREAVDLCHYSLVRTILIYLNTSDLSPLVSGQSLPKAESSALSPEKSPTWRKNVDDQRNLIMSSYPFLRYAVDNLLYHLLSPRPLRYFLPQQALFNTYSSNDCRIWRRWTALLGETDASAILAGCKSAEELLQPEFGASCRLERVFRAVNKMATGDSWFSPRRNLRLPVEARKAKGDEVAHQKLDAPRPLSLPLSRTTRRGPRSRGTVITTRRR